MPRLPLAFVLLSLSAACGEVSQAAAVVPQVTIGRCHQAEFSGQCKTYTWSLAGELRGELKATLRHFAGGAEQVHSVAAFSAASMPIVGEVVLVVRQGAPLGSKDERFVELRMPVRRDPDASPAVGDATFVSTQPTVALRLPATQLRKQGVAEGGVFRCVPQQSNQIELWSEAHSDRASTLGQVQPWSEQQKALLERCVDGVEETVLTIEHTLDMPSPREPR